MYRLIFLILAMLIHNLDRALTYIPEQEMIDGSPQMMKKAKVATSLWADRYGLW